MTQKKLFEILSLIGGSINIPDYKIMRMVKEEVPNSKIVNKLWADSYKNRSQEYYPLDLSKDRLWTTYDKCVDLRFTNKDGKLFCAVRIYEGDMCDGYRTSLRFTVEMILPNSFIKKIESYINWSLEVYLANAYETHLENKRGLWIQNERNLILDKK
jgi:hypothetical protein